MAKEQKRNQPLGPTDNAKRPFHDSFNEDTRYDKKEKRRRRMERERLDRIKNSDPDDWED